MQQLLNDPIVKTLMNNSHLTKAQVETLLIDVLAENISEKPLRYDEKARLRLTRSESTKGAFHRTLQQARRNIARAIYTVLLLGYLGLLEHVSLLPYVELANKLEDYVKAYKGVLNEREERDKFVKAISGLREEIELMLKDLSPR